MKTKIKKGQTVLFVGDSITDCGRRAADRPLGFGYVKIFHDLMAIREPEKNILIINKGISGNRVTDLQSRWTDDVLPHRPDWLSVKIGINDLHSVIRNTEPLVTPKVFEKVYDEILARTKKKLPACKLLLIDPFYLSKETSDNSPRKQVLDLLPQYISVVHKMSKKYKTALIKTHEIFQKLLDYHEVDLFCNEPVHPNLTGHLMIAEEVYKVFCSF